MCVHACLCTCTAFQWAMKTECKRHLLCFICTKKQDSTGMISMSSSCYLLKKRVFERVLLSKMIFFHPHISFSVIDYRIVNEEKTAMLRSRGRGQRSNSPAKKCEQLGGAWCLAAPRSHHDPGSEQLTPCRIYPHNSQECSGK